MGSHSQKLAKEIFSLADLELNGKNPWDIHIYNPEFYKRAITEGELGVGESYMDLWWDSESVDELICKILRARLDKKVRRKFILILKLINARIFNLQSKKRAFIIGERHYDLGNNLFKNMLDERMNYSCDSLNQAQENKLDLICRKLYLKPGLKILDIGCGWGAFGKYAAEKYGVETMGITVSNEQIELGRKLCEGLPVEFRKIDYREMIDSKGLPREKFDRIVSVGMIEHVGYKNYRTFFEVTGKCLKDDGLFLLHTIGNADSVKSIDPWTHKYIFPNGMLPSIAQLSKEVEDIFIIEDLHNFGADYDKTLMAWYANFTNSWDKIKSEYDERFYRMWKYFLLSSAGSFRARQNQLWQIVLSKHGVSGGYRSKR